MYKPLRKSAKREVLICTKVQFQIWKRMAKVSDEGKFSKSIGKSFLHLRNWMLEVLLDPGKGFSLRNIGNAYKSPKLSKRTTQFLTINKFLLWRLVPSIIILTWIGRRAVENQFAITGQVLTIIHFSYTLPSCLTKTLYDQFLFKL